MNLNIKWARRRKNLENKEINLTEGMSSNDAGQILKKYFTLQNIYKKKQNSFYMPFKQKRMGIHRGHSTLKKLKKKMSSDIQKHLPHVDSTQSPKLATKQVPMKDPGK